MPAIGVKIKDDEVLALKGDFKAAAREIEREYRDLQRKILDDLKNGRVVDPQLAAQGQNLLNKQQGYLDKVKQQSETNQMVENSIIKKLGDFLNVHNPHGQLRSILHGRFTAGQVESGVRFGASQLGNLGFTGAASSLAGAAGGVGVAAAAGLRIGNFLRSEFIDPHFESDIKAANIENKMAGERYNEVWQNRFNPGLSQFYQNRLSYVTAARSQASTGYNPLHQWLNGAEERAQAAQHAQGVYNAARRPGSRIHDPNAALAAGDFQQYMNRGEVNRRFEYSDTGKSSFFEWLKSQTFDRLTGQREYERRQYARELALRTVKGMEQRADEEQKVWDEDPVNKVSMRELSLHDRAVAEWDIKHFNDWNKV